jgi:hypothetical protein
MKHFNLHNLKRSETKYIMLLTKTIMAKTYPTTWMFAKVQAIITSLGTGFMLTLFLQEPHRLFCSLKPYEIFTIQQQYCRWEGLHDTTELTRGLKRKVYSIRERYGMG